MLETVTDVTNAEAKKNTIAENQRCFEYAGAVSRARLVDDLTS